MEIMDKKVDNSNDEKVPDTFYSTYDWDSHKLYRHGIFHNHPPENHFFDFLIIMLVKLIVISLIASIVILPFYLVYLCF